MQQTSDGGYILAGQSSSGLSGDKTEASMGTYDYWIVKLTSTGSILWQNTIGGLNEDYIFSIQQTTDDGYILGGYSYSGATGDKTEASMGSGDYWVIKLNSTGGIVWQNTIGGSGDENLFCVRQTSDGGYILGGTSSSGISGDKTEPNIGLTDYWVVKLNATGSIIWQNTIGGTEADILRCVKQTTDGGYILGGYSYSGMSGDKTENNWDVVDPITSDYWVIKLNTVGAIEWQNTIGGNNYDNLYDIFQTPDGGYMLGGQSYSGVSGDKTETSLSSWQYWIIKLNSAGNILEWQNTIGGDGTDALYSINPTSDGGYILGGHSSSNISGDKTENAIGSYDFWVIKTDIAGNLLWQNTIGGTDQDYLRCVQQTSDGGYFLGGYSSSPVSGDKTEGNFGAATTFDIWVMKLSPECTPAAEICNALDDDCDGLVDDGITETISISAGGATTFCSGGSVVLTAVASGTSLQWKKGATSIAGATASTYTATTSGIYTCTITSACGTATSTGITVAVNKNPSASITAGGPTTFCTGSSVTLTEAASAGCSYQWYKGATALAGATTTTYVATTTGNYKCRVTKTATGCYKNSNTISVSVTCREGVEIFGDDFSVFPNPATDFITLNSSVANYYFTIMDIAGNRVKEKAAKSNSTDCFIGDLPPGIYFIRIETVENAFTYTFIKQ